MQHAPNTIYCSLIFKIYTLSFKITKENGIYVKDREI